MGHRRSIAHRLASRLIAPLLMLAWAFAGGAQSPTTTVILVRHAERAALTTPDPPLTESGMARARELAVVLRDAGVQAIVTTQYARTRATAAPLATLLGVPLDVIPDTDASHARTVARAILDRHAGHTVLVIGHAHTVPAIIGALGAPMPPPICETVFDQLFVVTVPPSGPAHLIRTRYGADSPADSACAPMRRMP
jgi:broad specificity phosphatase PhoE